VQRPWASRLHLSVEHPWMMAYSGTGPCLRLDALAHSAACSSRHAPASGSRLHPQEVPRGARTSASASSLDCSGSVMHRSNTTAAALLTAGASSRDARSAAAVVANLQLVVANFCFGAAALCCSAAAWGQGIRSRPVGRGSRVVIEQCQRARLA